MLLPVDQQKAITSEIQRCTRIGLEKYGVNLNTVEIKWSNKLNRSAGSCSFYFLTNKVVVQFSSKILECNGLEKFFPTIAHELGHAIDYLVIRKKFMESASLLKMAIKKAGHGSDWVSIMGSLGEKAEVYHTMSRPKKSTFKCLSCGKGHKLTQDQASELINAKSTGKKAPWVCATCRGPLA